MEALRDPEEKIICPYNSSHHIRRYKMNTHLVKCKKSYPNSKLVECDFNVNHKVPEPELQYHHENCPDRAKIEIAVYQEEGTDINKFPIQNKEVPDEESWDDFDVKAYDPSIYCESSNVIRHVDVESAAKRKNFRFSERHRVNQLNNGREACGSQRIQPNRDDIPSSFRRTLPDRPNVSLKEATPDTVAIMTERIKKGKNTAYLSK